MRFGWVEPNRPDWAGRIAQARRPRAGRDLAAELSGLRGAGVDVVVSCLTDDEVRRFELKAEPAVCSTLGLEFFRFPIVDHSLPASFEDAVAFADFLLAQMRSGRSIVVHCFAGIGRSGLMTVATLMRGGLGRDEAIAVASQARGLSVPETAAQGRWLREVTRLGACPKDARSSAGRQV